MFPYKYDSTKSIKSQAVIYEEDDDGVEMSIPVLQSSPNGEVLQDGKINWKGYKMKGERIADIVQLYDSRKASFIRNCGNHLVFGLKPDGGKVLLNADFCRYRVCPMCAWRRSYRLGTQMDELFRVLLSRNPDAHLSFLTLTLRNCSADELPHQIKLMADGHRYMVDKVPAFKSRVQGFYRAMEITYNSEFDTYHAHYHYILHMADDYYNGNYLSTAEWVQLWKKVCKLDYDPICDIRAINDTVDKSITDAVREACKYPIKPIKYGVHDDIHKSAEVLETIDNNLKGLRLLAFGGTIKTLRAELKQADIESKQADLVGAKGGIEIVQKMAYVWRNGFYYRNFDSIPSESDFEPEPPMADCENL